MVLAAIDLEKEPAMIKERQLRFRKLTIQPGGIVPWHSHADRPAIIYIAEGEIIEYASNCAYPIVHKAGDIPLFLVEPRFFSGRAGAMCQGAINTRE